MKKINENLTDQELFVLKDKGTERPFTGKFDSFFENGSYHCKNCSVKLFESDTKFDAGCGWPSFFQAEDGIRDLVRSRGLGDVYKRQGPKETTGLRYCVNSVSLDFEAEKNN